MFNCKDSWFFKKSHTCLLPDKIQSIHWTQETAAVYRIVVLRKGDIREVHLTSITDNKKHSVSFTDLCNESLHDLYKTKFWNIGQNVEYNEG